MSAQVELALDARADLGEGPVWDPVAAVLWWVDINVGAVHRFSPATGTDRHLAVGQPVGCLAVRQRGGLVLALRDGFAFLDDDAAGPARLVAPIAHARPHMQFNDGGCDPRGRFWAGSTSARREPGAGILYRLDADRTVTAVLDGIGMANGIGWSPDGRRMYYVDSRTQGLDVFDFDPDEGAIASRRRLVDIDRSVGIPDGLAVDADGCVWLAVWGSSRVFRYTPGGRRDMEVRVPVSQVTSCTFGGPDLGELFITSAAAGLVPEAEPLAGGVFVTRPGVSGLPTTAFAG